MPHQQKFNSFDALRTLKITSKRNDGVQITRAGSHYRARFRGHSNFVFGASESEARTRLLSAQSKRWGIAPTPIESLEQRLMESLR